MATSVVNPRVQFFASNGRPLIGGRIHTYVAGSSTRARTYKDAAKAQPNTNPIILDGRGEAQIYLAEGVEYKFVVEDSKGALIYTQEPVYGAVWPNAEQWPSNATLAFKYAIQAEEARDEAYAAAESIGVILFFDTYSDYQGDALPPSIVEIANDETRGGARTRYKVLEDGGLQYVVTLMSEVTVRHSIFAFESIEAAEASTPKLPAGAIVEAPIDGVVYRFRVSASALTDPKKIGHAVEVRDFLSGSNIADGIQAAIKSAYESKAAMLIFDGADFLEVDKGIFLNSYGVLDRDLNVVGLKLRLTSATLGGAILNIGRGSDAGSSEDIEYTGRVIIHNPIVDGSNIPGENGYAFARVADAVLINPRAVNCKRDYTGSREGGRGFTAHPRSRNVTLINYQAVNCSDAFHVSHAPDYRADQSKNTTITGVTRGVSTRIKLASNTFVPGDYVYVYSAGGITGLNPSYSNQPAYPVTASVGDTITIAVDSTGMADWTSGGNVVLADMTDGGRSTGIRVYGMYAEDCEYSLVNIEAANWPRTTSPIQSVFMSGVVAKNCGTTATRGLINGNNAVSLQIESLSVVNDASHPVQSIIRGSFQHSRIVGVYDIHTLVKAVVDADPTSENPVGTGIDAGLGTHPYGTSFDNKFDVQYVARGSAPPQLINATDISGAVDRFYRNDIGISVTGLPDGTLYSGAINNIALHYTNIVKIKDVGSARSYEGQLTVAGRQLSGPNGEREFAQPCRFSSPLKISEVSGVAAIQPINAAGSVLADFRFTSTDGRWRIYSAGELAWQFSTLAFLPGKDNAQTICSAGLRASVVYANTGTINTSDEREKTTPLPIDDAVLDAWGDVQIICFQWLQAIAEKGDAARWHFGVIAQQVRDAFFAHGIDGTRYGLLCYDEWEAKTEVLNEDGNVVDPAREAGSRWGIRADQCLFLEAAFQRREAQRMKTRLAAIEATLGMSD